jgi:hypothetical protein
MPSAAVIAVEKTIEDLEDRFLLGERKLLEAFESSQDAAPAYGKRWAGSLAVQQDLIRGYVESVCKLHELLHGDASEATLNLGDVREMRIENLGELGLGHAAFAANRANPLTDLLVGQHHALRWRWQSVSFRHEQYKEGFLQSF